MSNSYQNTKLIKHLSLKEVECENVVKDVVFLTYLLMYHLLMGGFFTLTNISLVVGLLFPLLSIIVQF